MHVDGDGFSLDLPPGWVTVETAALGETGVSAFPPIAMGAGGTAVLQAHAPHGGGALFVVRVPAPLTVDSDLRDALSIVATEAFDHQWGIDVRIAWTEQVDLAGRDTIQIQGSFVRDGARKLLLVAFIPGPGYHDVVTYVMRADDDLSNLSLAAASLATFTSPPPASSTLLDRFLSRNSIGALGGALVGLLVAVWLRARRRGAGEP